MRRFWFLFSLFLFLGALSPTVANGAYLERITEYTSDIIVSKDASSEITENITAQIQGGGHGIIWTYPYIYGVKSFQRPTVFDVKSVCYYPKGNPSQSLCGRYEESTSNGWVTLKIGDAERTLSTGEYVYAIKDRKSVV